MTDIPAGGPPSLASPQNMLTTGELAEAVGRGLTTRKVRQMIEHELIPFARIGTSWVQIPAWVAGELCFRLDRQVELRLRLGVLSDRGDDPTVVAERDAIRAELADLEGPIRHVTHRPDTPPREHGV